jgi:hypothetical protein
MSNEPKLRYNDEELQEFKALIESKLALAKEEVGRTDQQITDLNENGFIVIILFTDKKMPQVVGSGITLQLDIKTVGIVFYILTLPLLLVIQLLTLFMKMVLLK